jgi:hypothetical protein
MARGEEERRGEGVKEQGDERGGKGGREHGEGG